MTRYMIYNLQIESAIALPLPLAKEPKDDHLILAWKNEAASTPDGQPFYTSPRRDRQGEPLAKYYKSDETRVLNFPGLISYYLESRKITYQCLPDQQALAQELMLSDVLAVVVEEFGLLALHASACVTPWGGLVFMGSSTSGKSSLAAGLLAIGHSLLTDDILAVEVGAQEIFGYPGIPVMNMWPQQARFFLGDEKNLPYVRPEREKRKVAIGVGGWGNFCGDKEPLAAVFLPRRDRPTCPVTECRITRLGPRQAFLAVLHYAFSPRLADALGRTGERNAKIATLVQRVPFFLLEYPTDYQQLARVIENVLASIPQRGN